MIFPQDTFNAFDHAGDGFIDSEKMAQVLANLGLQFQQNDIVEVIQVRDHISLTLIPNLLIRQFTNFQTLHEGHLGYCIFEDLVWSNIHKLDANDMFQEIGTDGRIMFDDFQRFMLNTDTEE